MKQFKSLVLFLVAVIVGTVNAYPEPAQPEPIVDLNDAVDEAVRQLVVEYVATIYSNVRDPKLEGHLEVIEELIAASLPEVLRQDVANELSDEVNGGTLSDDLEERIRQYILDWILQYLPTDVRDDIATVLEEYRATGQVIGNHEALLERIRQRVTAMKLDDKRNKRGFWKGLLESAAVFCVQYLFGAIFGFFG